MTGKIRWEKDCIKGEETMVVKGIEAFRIRARKKSGFEGKTPKREFQRIPGKNLNEAKQFVEQSFR